MESIESILFFIGVVFISFAGVIYIVMSLIMFKKVSKQINETEARMAEMRAKHKRIRDKGALR